MIWLWSIFVLISAWFVLPYAAKKIQIGLLRKRCRVRRLISLTYDDGPSVCLTTALLEMLRGHGAVASFFVLGHKFVALREQVARVVGAGHELGCHSYQHLHAWKCAPVSVFMDIHRGFRVVGNAASSRLFRAPHGKTTLGTLLQVAVSGWKQSWWTIDSTDTWESPRDIAQIVEQVRREGGGVILMHDMDRPGHPERETFVLDLTHALLDLAETENFRICTLGEVLNA